VEADEDARMTRLSPRDPADNGSIPDRVEAELRELILRGTIEPGQRINVRQLEQYFGASHIPIREAIRRLESEGLVETSPGRGATAARVSLQELDEIYDLRRIVEPQVVRRSVLALTDDDVATVVQAYERLEVAEKDGLPDFSDLHGDFHWQILRPGSSDEIERLLRKLWRVADRYLRLTKGIAVAIAHDQHLQLVEACRARDGDEAADLLAAHLHLTGNALRARFDASGLGHDGGSAS
jgi:DNA-binding GntR family transcriptional regulator